MIQLLHRIWLRLTLRRRTIRAIMTQWGWSRRAASHVYDAWGWRPLQQNRLPPHPDYLPPKDKP